MSIENAMGKTKTKNHFLDSWANLGWVTDDLCYKGNSMVFVILLNLNTARLFLLNLLTNVAANSTTTHNHKRSR